MDSHRNSGRLPVFAGGAPRSNKRRRPISIIHIIPVIVFLAFFILWWFSHPVNIIIKDSKKVFVISPIDLPTFNASGVDVDFAVLASSSASPPPSTMPKNNVTIYDQDQPGVSTPKQNKRKKAKIGAPASRNNPNNIEDAKKSILESNVTSYNETGI